MSGRTVAPGIALLMVLLVAAPAQAAGELSLSRDGSTWVEDLTDPLFDPALTWVPGDERERTFFVRNTSTEAGRLTVDILGVDVDSLMETGDLTVSARGGGAPWTAVDQPGTRRLVTQVLPSDDVRPVDVQVAFAPTSGNVSQLTALDLRLRVTLTQASATDGSLGGAVGDSGALLPGTGAARGLLALTALGCLLLLVGSVLAGRRAEARHG